MNGFHVCKAGNAPTVGQVKTFVVNGDRIKSRPVDQGGAPYTITAVTVRESYKDAYGNVGYDLDIEPAQNGAPRAQAALQRAATTGGSDDRSNRIERQHSQEMAIRYAALKGLDALDTEELRKLIDWFQRDVGRMPAPPKATTAPEPEMDEEMMPQGDADEEESF